MREELRLGDGDGHKLQCLTAANCREAATFLPAGAKFAALRQVMSGVSVTCFGGGVHRCLPFR